MFEKEIKFITDFSLEKIKSLGSYFTFDDILNTDLHPSITKYISAELSYLIFEDREMLLSSSIFDYSQPNIIKLLKSVDNELKKFKTISYEDIKKLVLQSVSFNANFVIRPKWSLAKLIYNEAETKRSEEVILMLDYIYSYEYLRNIVTEYIEKKKLLAITKDKFEEIISKIDSALIQNDLQSYIDNSLSTMLDFFSIGNKNKINISTDYVEIFLKEKDLLDPLLKLKKTFAFGTGAAANLEEIKKVLTGDEITGEIDEKELVIDEEVNKTDTEEVGVEKEVQTEMEDIFNTPVDETASIEEDVNLAGTEETVEDVPEEVVTVDESETENEEISNNDTSEISEEENLKTEDKTEILNIENDDELLSLFDEELKALAKDSDIDEDLEISTDDENNSEIEEAILPDNEITQSNENVEEIKTENDLESPEEIEVKVDDDQSEVEIQTTDSDEEKEDDNFIEGISDETLVSEEDELQEDEEISDDVKDEIEDEHEAETVTNPQREKDIFHYLSDKEIEKIVSNVFNEDQEDFAITLEKVSECETLDEANEIIKGVFISYRVNMYTKDASTLTSAISNYFNQ